MSVIELADSNFDHFIVIGIPTHYLPLPIVKT